MGTCATCEAELTGRQRRFCSDRCRVSAYRARRRLTTLSCSIDIDGAKAFGMIARAHGMSRSQALHELVSSYIRSVAAVMAGPAPKELPADQRSTHTTNVRTP